MAEELRQKALEASKPMMALMDEATREGFLVSVAFGQDAFKRSCIVGLHIVKQFFP